MSTPTPIYWIDSNVLISAKNGPFRFSVAPGFWTSIEAQATAGKIRVSKLVYEEIVGDGPDDELATWLKARRLNGFCVTPDQNVQLKLRQIADHVQNTYSGPQAAKFLSGADPWVIAHALSCRGVVVTFETYQQNTKKAKIPNVCIATGAKFMNLYDMLQQLGIQL